MKVTCKQTTLKINEVNIPTARSKTPEAPLTPQEMQDYMSIVGSLSWVARVCRSDLSYNVSQLQQLKKDAKVKTLKLAIKVIRFAKAHCERGFTFKSGVLDWENMALLSATDASHAQELGENGEPYRSQGGILIMLGSADVLKNEETNIHPLYHQSATLKRVVRATYQAETYQVQLGGACRCLARSYR